MSTQFVTAEHDISELYLLKKNVQVIRKSGKILLLPRRGEGRPASVSVNAGPIIARLANGATMDELTLCAKEASIGSQPAREAAQQFLARLADLGLIEGKPAVKRGHSRRLTLRVGSVPDWVSHAGTKLGENARRCLLTITLGSSVACIGLALVRFTGHSTWPVQTFSFWGVVLAIFLTVFAHELAHAIAFRMAGFAVAELYFSLEFPFRAFVDVTELYGVKERSPRFWVAAAGPIDDLLLAGTAALASLLSGEGSVVFPFAFMLFVVSSVAAVLNLNPFLPTDGAAMLHAIFDDDQARESALFRNRESSKQTILKYRIACAAYAFTVVPIFLLIIQRIWMH